MTGRTIKAQAVTAALLLAQFDEQIREHDAMNRDQRRTPRGRDLESRIDALRQGKATWSHRLRVLQSQLPPEGN